MISKPPLVTSSSSAPQTSVGDRVGGIITATCSLHLISNFTSSNFMMKCLRHFLLEILKKTINALSWYLLMIEIRAGFNSLIAFSLISLLSPDHNWHIYMCCNRVLPPTL